MRALMRILACVLLAFAAGVSWALLIHILTYLISGNWLLPLPLVAWEIFTSIFVGFYVAYSARFWMRLR